MSDFHFGHASMANLLTCHDDLQRVAQEALRTSDIDFGISCGHRNKFEQDKCCAEGKSKTPWPTSKHNSMPSRAFDFFPLVNGRAAWEDREAFKDVAHHILMTADRLGISLRWGGDWDCDGIDNTKGFIDLPHMELK
jgi:peptidoglycan L-alanyl-D-glutamate endopeptidase CwlK